MINNRDQLPAWRALAAHKRELETLHMRELFSRDTDRFTRFSLGAHQILLDYSKNLITAQTMTLLLNLAREVELERWIERLFDGEAVNNTERRPAMHMALRASGATLGGSQGSAIHGRVAARRDGKQRIPRFAESANLPREYQIELIIVGDRRER